MKQNLIAFILAIVFGIGLAVSGMLNPANVIGFLDIFGVWKPALALVMASGIAVALPFFMIAKGRKSPVLEKDFHNPPKNLDNKIFIGSAIFGIGWGVAGICPGPALVLSLVSPLQILPFIIAMFAGLFVADFALKAKPRQIVPAE